MTSLGATLLAISPQLEQFCRETAVQYKLGFDLLSDPGNRYASKLGLFFTLPPELREIYRKFGIDLARYNGDDSWSLPMPARLVVDRSGFVRSIETDPDYTVRPEPAETVMLLSSLQRG